MRKNHGKIFRLDRFIWKYFWWSFPVINQTEYACLKWCVSGKKKLKKKISLKYSLVIFRLMLFDSFHLYQSRSPSFLFKKKSFLSVYIFWNIRKTEFFRPFLKLWILFQFNEGFVWFFVLRWVSLQLRLCY